MPVHIEPVEFIVRGYSTDDGFELHRPFDFVASMFVPDRKTAYLHAMHGRLTKERIREIQAALLEMGIESVFADRHGRMREWSTRDYLIQRDKHPPGGG